MDLNYFDSSHPHYYIIYKTFHPSLCCLILHHQASPTKPASSNGNRKGLVTHVGTLTETPAPLAQTFLIIDMPPALLDPRAKRLGHLYCRLTEGWEDSPDIPFYNFSHSRWGPETEEDLISLGEGRCIIWLSGWRSSALCKWKLHS